MRPVRSGRDATDEGSRGSGAWDQRLEPGRMWEWVGKGADVLGIFEGGPT
jgi:hypothetical protein